jgi:hypothetical protein
VLWLLAAGLGSEARAGAPDRLAFWDRQRKGANCQNRHVGPEYWRAAVEAGLEFVRLLPDAWPTRNRDFLMGSADGFTALDEVDLAVLVRSLDDAHAAGVEVILAPISLPGARWKQLNGDRDDSRLWKDPRYQAQAEAFWRQLAGRLRGHPAIVAYNPLNEPHPERAFGFEEPGEERFAEWRAKAKGTPADLDAFNRRMVAAIRSADPDTPVLLDGWFYASPAGLSLLEPIEAKGILYAFHFYDPWEYSTFRVNQGPLVLPGTHARPRREGGSRRSERDARTRGAGRELGARARHPAEPDRGRGVRCRPPCRRRSAVPRGPGARAERARLALGPLSVPGRRRLDRARLRDRVRSRRPAHLGRRGAWRGPREVQAPPRQPTVAGAET